jgi:hypothetical protein
MNVSECKEQSVEENKRSSFLESIKQCVQESIEEKDYVAFPVIKEHFRRTMKCKFEEVWLLGLLHRYFCVGRRPYYKVIFGLKLQASACEECTRRDEECKKKDKGKLASNGGEKNAVQDKDQYAGEIDQTQIQNVTSPEITHSSP